MKYCWKTSGFSADANKIGKELENLEKDLIKLTNNEVLNYARNNVDSELHKCFDWDNESAGEKYRLRQASAVLSSIAIVIKEEKKESTKVYYSLKTSNDKDNCEFKNIMKILENDEEYKQLLNKAEKEFKSYKQKYENTLKLSDLKNIIYKNL